MNYKLIIACVKCGMMQSFNQLQSFLEVAKLGSFSKAASVLGVSTTAISKQVKLLEARLSEQLFMRTTRTVHLTEFGERLFKHASNLSSEIEALERFIESKHQAVAGDLRVLVSSILSKNFILEHLAEFVRRFPKIRMELIFSEDEAFFSDHAIDVMVGFPEMGPITDPLKYRKLFDCHNILVASPVYLDRYGKIDKPEDLLQAVIITHSLRKPDNLIPLSDGSMLPTAKPILYMNDFEALNRACIDGLGIFLTGDVLVSDALERGELLQLLPNLAFKHYQIFMFYRNYDYELPKIRSFIEFYDAINKGKLMTR